MIRFTQIDNSAIWTEEEKKILQNHLNILFRHINAFMVCMVPGFVSEGQVPENLKNDPLIKDPTWACPVSMGDKKECVTSLRELIIKVFDEQSYHELTIAEKYTLAQISNIGIQKEEQMIEHLVSEKKKSRLNDWMRYYQISDFEEREKIRRKLLEQGEDIDLIEQWLEDRGMKYRNSVIASIGCLPLVKYEYPTAITALFSDDEWEQIVKMDDLEKMCGRGPK